MRKKRFIGSGRTDYTATETKKNVIKLYSEEYSFEVPKRKWYQVFLKRRDKIFREGYVLGYGELRSKLHSTFKITMHTSNQSIGIGMTAGKALSKELKPLEE